MKKSWLGLIAVSATVGAIALFSARRIEAQYASPVRVTNSSSAPAIGSMIDERGRIPYQASRETFLNFAGEGVTFSFSPVPANHRLVITHVVGIYNLNASAPTTWLSLGDSTAHTMSSFFAPTGQFRTLFDMPVLAYFDAGQIPVTGVQASAPVFINGEFSAISGYLIDCAAAPCAPIAN